RERDAEVVEDYVQGVAPPCVPLRAEVVQDHPEIEADLESDLTFLHLGRAVRIAFRRVRGREEQVAERADPQIEPAPESFERQIRREGLVRIIAAHSRIRLAAVPASGGGSQDSMTKPDDPPARLPREPPRGPPPARPFPGT